MHNSNHSSYVAGWRVMSAMVTGLGDAPLTCPLWGKRRGGGGEGEGGGGGGRRKRGGGGRERGVPRKRTLPGVIGMSA